MGPVGVAGGHSGFSGERGRRVQPLGALFDDTRSSEWSKKSDRVRRNHRGRGRSACFRAIRRDDLRSIRDAVHAGRRPMRFSVSRHDRVRRASELISIGDRRRTGAGGTSAVAAPAPRWNGKRALRLRAEPSARGRLPGSTPSRKEMRATGRGARFVRTELSWNGSSVERKALCSPLGGRCDRQDGRDLRARLRTPASRAAFRGVR